MSRPRVLFLVCHLPFPPISGGRRRELELLKRVSADADIHLLVASKTPEEDQQNASHLARWCGAVEVFACAGGEISPRAKEPAQVLRHTCPDLTGRVRELLATGDYDLVHVEGFYLMQHVPDDVEVPVMLVEQNIEYELWRQRAATARDETERAQCLWQYLATLEAEIAAWRRADRVGALTPEDAATIRAAEPGTALDLVPDGSDHLAPGARDVPRAEVVRPAAPLMVFLGNFAYAPNVDAATYLCEEVMPLVRRKVPDVQLWLVGNEPPAATKRLETEGVRVTGRVPSVEPYLDAADVVVCPLRIGGGIKVKVIEALWRGKAIVTTSVGAQGFDEPVRSALAIADEAPVFSEIVARLLVDPRLRGQLEERAVASVAHLPSWDSAAATLLRAYRRLLRVSSGSTPSAPSAEAALMKAQAVERPGARSRLQNLGPEGG